VCRDALKSASAQQLTKSQGALGALCVTVAYDVAHTLRKTLVYTIGAEADDSLDLMSKCATIESANPHRDLA
jgi:hypothetical protein